MRRNRHRFTRDFNYLYIQVCFCLNDKLLIGGTSGLSGLRGAFSSWANDSEGDRKAMMASRTAILMQIQHESGQVIVLL